METTLRTVLSVVFLAIIASFVYGCATTQPISTGASQAPHAPGLAVDVGDMRISREPQPFLRTIEFDPANKRVNPIIDLAGLHDDEVWLIVILNVVSDREREVHNMTDIDLLTSSGSTLPGYYEDDVWSQVNPEDKQYAVVFDSLESKRLIRTGRSALKIAFEVPMSNLANSIVRLLEANAAPIKEEDIRERVQASPPSKEPEDIHSTDVNAKNSMGYTLLHTAAFKGDLPAVETLISKGARIDVLDNDGDAPLHKACFKGNVEVAELLLSKGASVDATESVNDFGTPRVRI